MSDTIKDRRFGQGFVMVPRAIADYADRIGVHGIGVYYAIAFHADPNGENAFPSLETIAKKCGVGLTKVKESLAIMDELNMVKRTRRVNHKGRTTNIYELTPDHEWVKPCGDQTCEVKPCGDQTPTREFGRVATINNIYNNNNTCADAPTTPFGGVEGKSNSQKRTATKATATTPTPPVALDPLAPKRKAEPKATPEEEAGWRMYLRKMEEYEPGAVINHGRERKGINQIVRAGWTDEQIGRCIDVLKDESFWQERHLSTQSIGTQIAAKVKQSKPVDHFAAFEHPDYIREMMGQ